MPERKIKPILRTLGIYNLMSLISIQPYESHICKSKVTQAGKWCNPWAACYNYHISYHVEVKGIPLSRLMPTFSAYQS